MAHFIGSNVLVDRGYASSISATYPAIGGHPLGNMLTRRLADTWQGAGSAGRYFAVNLNATPLYRVAFVWLVGCTLAGNYRIRIANAAGTGGVAVHDATYAYGGNGPCAFVLPTRYSGAFVSVFGPSAGTIEVARLVLGDLVDVSDSFRTDWGHTFVDPNAAQSSGPGGAFVDTSQVARKQRSFSLVGVDDADLFGLDDATAHGTSLSEIAASCGTTGEVILLPRVTPGVTDGSNQVALGDFAIYGTLDRAMAFKTMGQGRGVGAGKDALVFDDSDPTKVRRLWQSGAMSLSSIADR